ncbi:uncharacterized protein [Coffea arabica]|uniref:Uncharacterized protein isoform X3 n=1 Tax=Coffea arabica TaxID=13443 RepID=A0A6P6U1B1_COFAR
MAAVASTTSILNNFPRINKFKESPFLNYLSINYLSRGVFPTENCARPSKMTICRTQMKMVKPNSFKNTSFVNHNGRIYNRLESCLVIPPPRGKKPKAIIKFLGGAFVGAVPEVTYSNGALLQVLTGSYFCEKIPKANAIISYNNRPASEAVPYFEQLGPLVSQIFPIMEASPVYSFTRNASADAWKVLLDTAGTMIPDYDPEVAVSVNKFVDQLPAVFNQLAEGISEFRPTPSENLDCFQKSYNVQHTLLVKFNVDAIDQTDLLEETLKPRVESIGGKLQKITLNGTHITPCIQEPRWQVGDIYSPVDAVAQGLKTISLNDTRVLTRTITDWFSQLEG